jgi:hypothetical protein
VVEPEQKRKIIGEEFIRVFEEQAERLDNPRYLVQGTLYSDVIESGGGTGAATIKSHHNVGGLSGGTSSSSWSSRCAGCSRTRWARSGPGSACPSGWCRTSRSRASGLLFALRDARGSFLNQ